MIFTDYDDCKNLPDGIIMTGSKPALGRHYWVKTGSSRWAFISTREFMAEEGIYARATEACAKGEINVSPWPAGWNLEIWNNQKNLDLAIAHYAGTAVRASRLQTIVNRFATGLSNFTEEAAEMLKEVRRG